MYERNTLQCSTPGNNEIQVGNLSWVIDFIPYKLSLETLIILTELDGCLYSIQINDLDSETTNVDLNTRARATRTH